jgi:hypothetical protein
MVWAERNVSSVRSFCYGVTGVRGYSSEIHLFSINNVFSIIHELLTVISKENKQQYTTLQSNFHKKTMLLRSNVILLEKIYL